MDGITAGHDAALTPAGARTALAVPVLVPVLELDGFSGSLERLLELARGQQIDLARLPMAALVEQVVATMAWDVPLSRRADWLVMGAWLLQLRSRLLLPAEAPARQAAEDDADRLRRRLLDLAEIQALAGWLDARPQLGRDVFARGVFSRDALARTAPDHPVALRPGEAELDVVAFLWTCVDLFDADLPQPETVERYLPPPRVELHTVADARVRILERLADAPDGLTLDQLLPQLAPASAADADAASSDTAPRSAAPAVAAGSTSPGGEGTPSPHLTLRRRSAWTSTFVAGLELAKQGEVALAQEASFSPVHLTLAKPMPSASTVS